MRWFSVCYFGYADILSGLLIEQAKLQLEASPVHQGSVFGYVREMPALNQAKTFMGLARQWTSEEVKGG
jgi:hypothetical protein